MLWSPAMSWYVAGEASTFLSEARLDPIDAEEPTSRQPTIVDKGYRTVSDNAGIRFYPETCEVRRVRRCLLFLLLIYNSRLLQSSKPCLMIQKCDIW